MDLRWKLFGTVLGFALALLTAAAAFKVVEGKGDFNINVTGVYLVTRAFESTAAAIGDSEGSIKNAIQVLGAGT